MARAQIPPSAETGWIKEAPSNEEAIEYVTMRQVERGHWSNEAKEYYYAKRAAALGVRRETVNRWEKDRKEITSDPELAKKATTPEGYKEAKTVARDRRITVERKGLLYALAPLK